jgi:signal peptidase
MKQTLKRICLALVACLLAVITTALLLYAAGVSQSAFGYRFLNVLTPSMAPFFQPGDMIVVKPCKPERVRVGDDITYRIRGFEQDVLVTHRVAKILAAFDGEPGLWFLTRGLNNAGPDDGPVEAAQLVGKVALRLPWLGRLAAAKRVAVPIVALLSLCGYGAAALLIWRAARRRRA